MRMLMTTRTKDNDGKIQRFSPIKNLIQRGKNS